MVSLLSAAGPHGPAPRNYPSYEYRIYKCNFHNTCGLENIFRSKTTCRGHTLCEWNKQTTAVAKFGQQFNYVETLWHSASTPVVLHCLRHNPPEKVEINPDHHLRKKGGCRQCKADSARARHGKTREVFIAEAKARHGEAFDYGKLVYVNAKTEVLIYCLKHCIELWQLPEVHLKGGGCPACKSAKLKKSNADLYGQLSVKYEEFLTRANLTHNGYYQYEPESYVGLGKNVRIICPNHGCSLNALSDTRAVVSARSAWLIISRSPSQYFGCVSSRNLARFFRSDSVPGQASKALSRHSAVDIDIAGA